MISILKTLGPAKYPIAVAGAALAGLAGWLYIAYERIDNLQAKVDEANRRAGQYELALQGKELDVSNLRDTISMQNVAIRELAEKRSQAEQRAVAQAELIASMKTPPAGDGAGAMQAWWDENVANR